MTARAVFVMHKAAAHNFSTSKYKALRRMGLCSGLASSNSNRAALSVYACVVYVWAAHARTASGGATAVVSGREIQRFFSPHSVLHGFVFYAADRGLPEEPPKELTVEFPEELLKEPLEELPEEFPKELPEMYQVGLY